jgi:hypothetical protein
MLYRFVATLLVIFAHVAPVSCQETRSVSIRKILHVGGISYQGESPLVSNYAYTGAGKKVPIINKTFTFFSSSSSTNINTIIITKTPPKPRASSVGGVRSMRINAPYLRIALERTSDTVEGTTSWSISHCMHTTPYVIRENDTVLVIAANPHAVDTQNIVAPVWDLSHATAHLPAIPFKQIDSLSDVQNEDAIAALQAMDTNAFHTHEHNKTAL